MASRRGHVGTVVGVSALLLLVVTACLAAQASAAAGGQSKAQELAAQIDAGLPVLFSMMGGLGKASDVAWPTMRDYIFTRMVGPGGDIGDINSDGGYSDIAYASFFRRDTFNTYFSNDGLWGKTGYAGVVYKRDAWDTSRPYQGQRMLLRQGWFIDSWPDYRFVSPPGTPPSKVTGDDRYYGLLKPSGYRTGMNWGYMAFTSKSITESAYAAAAASPGIAPPPYVAGTRGGKGFFDYRLDHATYSDAAFLAYYRDTMRRRMSGANGFRYEGAPGASPYVMDGARDSAHTVTAFQAYVDFAGEGSPLKALDLVARLRNLYFGAKDNLWANSDTQSGPFGNEIEVDVVPFRRENRTDGEPGFISHMVPYSAVDAVQLAHDGPKWTLATRPQPPHVSWRAASPADAASPEYFTIYRAALVMQAGVAGEAKKEAAPAAPPPLVEAHNVWGTRYAMRELQGIVEGWRAAGPAAGSEIFSDFVDFYGAQSGPGLQVVQGDSPQVSKDLQALPAGAFLRVLPPKGGREALLLNLAQSPVPASLGAWVEGGAGDDALSGSRGSDDLYGGAGADKLAAYSGADRLTGGPGVDSFRVADLCRQGGACAAAGGAPTRAIVTDMERGEALELPAAPGEAARVELRARVWPGIKAEGAMLAYRGTGYVEVLLGGAPVAEIWRAAPGDLRVRGNVVERL